MSPEILGDLIFYDSEVSFSSFLCGFSLEQGSVISALGLVLPVLSAAVLD